MPRSLVGGICPANSADQGLGVRSVPFYLQSFNARADSLIRYTKNQERRKLPC